MTASLSGVYPLSSAGIKERFAEIARIQSDGIPYPSVMIEGEDYLRLFADALIGKCGLDWNEVDVVLQEINYRFEFGIHFLDVGRIINQAVESARGDR